MAKKTGKLTMEIKVMDSEEVKAFVEKYKKLQEYAQHKDGCASLKDYNGIKHWLHNCNCGLDKIIGGE